MERLALVVAVAHGGVIGRANQLPWRIPEDLAHFRRVTLGHAVIVGRKTFESIGKPLPDRRNIVVSRSPGLSIPGCEVAPDLARAIAMARETDDEPRVIGGAALYAEALPRITRIYLTEIDRDVEGDTFFRFDRSTFRETERRAGKDPGVVFVVLDRIVD
jgi:dihydrofolate reductase